MLIGGTSGETTTLKNSLTTNGWTFINYDLNKGCGSSSDYVYLLYKAEADTSGDRDYVTGFYIKSGASGVTNTFTSGGKIYTLTPYVGGSHFKGQKGDLNSNTGESSASIHLYYTKDNSSGTAIKSVTFNATQSGALGANGASSPGYDLNDGCGSGTDYIYMHVTTSFVTYDLTYDLAGGTLSSANPATYTANTATFTLNEPTRAGYTFTGWTWDGQTTPTKPVTISQGSTGNKSYTANWNANPKGNFDACTGGAGEIAVAGWAYDPDMSSQSISVQVKVFQIDGSTLVTQETFAADCPRNDVNSAYNITGQHGYSATIDGLDADTYKVKVYALDTNDGTNPQLGSTQTVTVTPGPITVTIGNEHNKYFDLPFYTIYNFSMSQQIYTAEEIGTAGTITSIAFQYAGALPDTPQSFSMNGVKVYLKHTDKNGFGSDTDMVLVSSADMVFEGTFSATDVGWVTITLDTPFEYDGNGNLLVCCLDPTDGKLFAVFNMHATDNNKGIHAWSDDFMPSLDGSNWVSGAYEEASGDFVFSSAGRGRNNIHINIIPEHHFAKPANLVVDSLEDTCATLTWTAPQTDTTITGYVYRFKMASDVSWSAEMTTTATSATISNLSSDTDYDFCVKTLYGSNESSYQILHFTTAIPLPYELGFENGMNHWSMVDCNSLTRISAGLKHTGEYGFGYGRYPNPRSQYIISPRFACSVPMSVLFYYYSAYGQNTFQVGYSTTSSDVGAFTWGEEITAVNQQWTLCENNFPVGTRYIAVKYISNASEFALDDFAFMVYYGPKPANLGVGGLTDTTATLTWTVPETTNTITGYAWQYKKAGDADWSAEVTTSATIATIGGLTANTDYECRVKTLYGSNASTYATIGFSTAESLPYECGFENGMDRWGMVDINWGYTGIKSDVKHDGENGFKFSYFWNDADKKPQYLISPRLADNVPMTVLFYYTSYTDCDTFQVGYSTTTSDVGAFTWGEEITAVNQQWTLCEKTTSPSWFITVRSQPTSAWVA